MVMKMTICDIGKYLSSYMKTSEQLLPYLTSVLRLNVMETHSLVSIIYLPKVENATSAVQCSINAEYCDRGLDLS